MTDNENDVALSRSALVSPMYVAALAILVANDWWLKSSCPGIITGKLSDIAGLFVFPLFVSQFLPRHRKAVYVSSLLGFVLWKTPFADPAIQTWNSLGLFAIGRVVDYTDYLALPVLPISYYYKPQSSDRRRYTAAYYVVVSVSWFAIVGTAGTHGKIEMYEFQAPYARLEKRVDSLLKDAPELTRVDSVDYDIADFGDTFTHLRLIDGNGDEVFAFRYYISPEYTRENPNKSRLSLTYVGRYKMEFRMGSELTENEMRRVSEKFQRMFLSRLGIPYTIVDE